MAQSFDIVLTILVDENDQLICLVSDFFQFVPQELLARLENQLQVSILHMMVIFGQSLVNHAEVEDKTLRILSFKPLQNFWEDILFLYQHQLENSL